jgi:hypothetical protein
MKKTLITMGLGAGVMYLFDPEHGEQRRAQLRGKLAEMLPKTREAVHAKADHLGAATHNLTEKVDAMASEAIATALPAIDTAAEGAVNAAGGAEANGTGTNGAGNNGTGTDSAGASGGKTTNASGESGGTPDGGTTNKGTGKTNGKTDKPTAGE